MAGESFLRSLGEAIRHLIYFLIAVSVTLLVVEGASSIIVFASGLIAKSSHMGSERIATRYDPLLGWSHVPSIRVKDMFGSGIDVAVNSQGFRADREYSISSPVDRARVVCAGDSFTYGYGVRLEDSWCHRLRVGGRAVESVNMAQIGYGLDQMYLWYRRDGVELQHDYLVVGTIFFDFTRMLSAKFEGFGKPTLSLQQQQLVAANVPVPRLQYFFPWVTRNWRLFRTLKFVELAEGVGQKLFPAKTGIGFSASQMEPIVAHLISELRLENERKKSHLIWVYLPVLQDFDSDYTASWKSFLEQKIRGEGATFVDLTPDFQRLDRRDRESMYLPDGVIGYPGDGGHYTARGNAFVADLISAKLPSVRRILRSGGSEGGKSNQG